MSDPVLRLSGIHKSYKRNVAAEVVVLKGADLTLEAGQVAALVAPSGAGKSTLLHIAGLLDTPDTGTVSVNGTAMAKASDRRRTRIRREEIGFIYQFHHLLPEFTALENIVLPQLANGQTASTARERAQMLLASVGLKDRSDHRPAALSGGEQQRVAFCRALANGPSLLLADEPTGNLDPDTSEMVFETLMTVVRDTGLAALIATHNPALAERMDMTYRLDSGGLKKL